LIEHDTHDEEFELGLLRKDFSLIQSSMIDNGKAPKGEPSLGSDSVQGGQGVTSQGKALLT